jgi:enoyl-CoA hydratase/carnithine racemase
MNRPEKLNAYNAKMVAELLALLADLASRKAIRALVFTGAGRAFSSGADIGPDGLGEGGFVADHYPRGGNLEDQLESAEIPTIAAINGLCVGGGLELAIACDFRIASAEARFGFPEVTWGMVPGAGCSRLVKLLGPAWAKRLVMVGDFISAQEALAIGLVHQVVEPAQLEDKTQEFIQRLLRGAPRALSLAKQLINDVVNVPLPVARKLEQLGASLMRNTEEQREGIAAFREKRVPAWTER